MRRKPSGTPAKTATWRLTAATWVLVPLFGYGVVAVLATRRQRHHDRTGELLHPIARLGQVGSRAHEQYVVRRRGHPAPGLIFHSDRGTQYTSNEFTDLLAEHRMTQSLSRPRQCWDNAVADSFFSSLKGELIHRQSWATRTQARRAIVDYTEVFFNRRRLHSSLGYLTPVEYEARRIHHHKAAQAAS